MQISWSKWFEIERLIHSTKTAIAALVGIILAKVIGFPADQWIVITIFVVMTAQIYVGSVIQKGYFRFMGTVIGCVIGVLALELFGHSLLTVGVTLALSGFFFSYLATGSEKMMYAATLGAATTAIIMLGQNPSVTYAAERFLEITIGILVATLISQFVLPIHARTHLRRTQAKTLSALREHYRACIMSAPEKMASLHYEEFDEAIVKLLSKQRQLAKDSIREPFGSDFDPEQCVQLLHCEKKILRSIDFMHHALLNIENPSDLQFATTHLAAFNLVIIEYFNTLIKIVEENKKTDIHLDFSSLPKLITELTQNASQASDNDRLYLSSLCFMAEILTQQLLKLSSLYQATLVEKSEPTLSQ